MQLSECDVNASWPVRISVDADFDRDAYVWFVAASVFVWWEMRYIGYGAVRFADLPHAAFTPSA
jgi:hypothetical protein